MSDADQRVGRRLARLRLEFVVVAAGIVFALLVVAATLAHLAELRRTAEAEVDGRLRTLSRVLAKEVNRNLLATQAVLDQLEPPLRTALDGPKAGNASRLLDGALRQMPQARGLAVVAADGHVIASTNRAEIGVDVSGYEFFASPPRGRLSPGTPAEGRAFALDGSRRSGNAFARSGFVAFTRMLATGAASPRIVVVFGADSLVNDLRFVAADPAEELSLYRYDGTLLATSSDHLALRTTPSPIFARFIPERESGRFSDADDDGERWFASFDTTADHPLVVEVRVAETLLAQRWRDGQLAPLAIMSMILVAVGFSVMLLRRALRQREASRLRLATQERRLRNILDTAADGIVTIDSRGIIREFNRAAETVFGLPAAEAIGQPLAALLPGPTGASHQAWVERYLLTGDRQVLGRGRTLRTRRRDGRPLEVYLAISEVIDQHEHFFTGIVRDVTNVRQAEERFRTLFQRSGTPHLLFDDNGLIDCNESAIKLLGAARREDLLGRTLCSLAARQQSCTRDSREVLAQATAEARRDGVKRLQWTAQSADGTEVPVEMTLTPLELAEQQAMLVAWHDMTERQRYENELREARDAAQSAAGAKASFLAMMSHELRTPMTGIIGMSDLLSDTPMNDEQAHLVAVLRNSAHSLLTVLNDILDVSKIEAGRLELEAIDFAPVNVAQDVIDLLAAAASERGNLLQPDWDATQIGAMRGDPTRLRQILFNLIGNAIKFTERGTITLSIAPEPASAPGTRRLRFAVADTGVGIPADVLPRLFTPFQQADSSTTRRFGGTGLGLAICRHLAQAMHGEIGVDSEPGAGSTFWFTVELAEATGAVAASDAPPAQSGVSVDGLRLLLAEDNPTNQLLITTRLRRAGHTIDIAENGREALAAAAERDYDLILMDMQMPELDGPGATRAIRALPGPRGQVPIVALTADALPGFREQYMDSGLTDYLTKPIDWQALHTTLARHGRRRGAAAAAQPIAASAAQPRHPEATGSGFDADERRLAPADRNAIATTRADFGDEVYEAALTMYWPKALADLECCRRAVAELDGAAWRAAAHGLKGASASMGFASIAAAAAALEQTPGEPLQARDALTTLQAAVERVQAVLGPPQRAAVSVETA